VSGVMLAPSITRFPESCDPATFSNAAGGRISALPSTVSRGAVSSTG